MVNLYIYIFVCVCVCVGVGVSVSVGVGVGGWVHACVRACVCLYAGLYLFHSYCLIHINLIHKGWINLINEMQQETHGLLSNKTNSME